MAVISGKRTIYPPCHGGYKRVGGNYIKKMQRYLLIFIAICLTSCATLINRRTYDLRVISKASNAQVQINDSIYKLPARVKVQRSKNDLPIKFISDTLTRNKIIKPSPNYAFVYGNLVCFYFCPVAYLIDFTNQKRFFYGRTLDLKLNDTSTIIRPSPLKRYYNYFHKNFPTSKGQINLKLSLPWINSFILHPENETYKLNTGFMGVSAGLEYYYKENKYISLTANAVTDFFIPIPAAVDYGGNYEIMSSTYLSLMNNIIYKRFSIGYGINYSKNTWDLRQGKIATSSMRVPITRKSQSIGITINGYHQLRKHLFIGLIYRPTFLNVKPTFEFKYQHLISFDFCWKFKLKK